MTLTHRPTPSDPAPTDHRASLHHALPAVVVHDALRREFRLAGPLVRRTAAGDAARAGIVSRHLDFLLRGLRHHHELEDDHIWPVLHARLPVGDRRTLTVMQEEHDEIVRLLPRIAQLLAAWPANAAAVAAFRNPLAEQVDELHRLLVAHLDREEREALPLAERHLSAAEWNEIGRLAESGNPRSERALAFGMLQYEGDPRVLASMLASAPAPARVLVPLLARRAYRRHAVAVHGTPTP